MTQLAQLPIINRLADGLRPDPILTVSEWADRNRQLDSRGSPEPGKWRTRRTPYLREIMDNFSQMSPVIETVWMKAAQIGATECANNLVGYVIDHSPSPGLFLQPSQDLANRNVRQKIDPMINCTPSLLSKVPSKRSKEGGNTTEEKEFPGGIWLFKWASSTSGLRSSSIRFLVLDEIDEYAIEVGAVGNSQGSPEDLARARTNAYGRRKKIFIPSTPTIEGRSRVAVLFDDSDQRYYMMPCPHCDEPINFLFAQLIWEKGRYDDVKYHCQRCSGSIEEWQKTWMMEEADDRNVGGNKIYGWVPSNPDNNSRRGYHLNGMYSPVGFKSWGEIAVEWDRAQGSREKLKTFINTVLAETWKEKGEAPDWQRLYDRRETYPINKIPDKRVLFLTAAVDFQGDRMEVEIKGWGRGKENWSIDYRVIPSHQKNTWRFEELDRLLSEQWEHPHGVYVGIARMAVDTGAFTQEIRHWARRHPVRVMAIKGSATAQSIISKPKPVDISHDGRRISNGLLEWIVASSITKSEVYGWLSLPQPVEGEDYPDGYCHYPQYDDEFFKGLTAEQVSPKIVRGYRQWIWEKTRDRNEPLDLMVYNRAAAAAMGVDLMNEQQWIELENSLAKPINPHIDQKNPIENKKNGIKFKKSDYWSK